MKKIISITLVLSMVLSLMTFGTLTASADTSFVDYTVYNDFSTASSDTLGLYDGLFKAGYHHNATYLLHGTVNGAARYGHIASPSKDVLQMPVDIAGKTSPVIVEWRTKLVGSSKTYAPVYGGASGGTATGTYSGLDGVNAGSSALKLSVGSTAKYRFVIDPGAKTITPYMDDEVKTSTVALDDGQETVYLGHQYETYYSSQASVTNASKLQKYIDLYYTAVYDDAEAPDFQIVSYDTAGATVQFNTPVTVATVAAMTVDGVQVASATDITSSTEEVETYSITFASELTEGLHTVAATGTSLTGKTISASKTIGEAVDTSLVKPLSVGGVVLNSVENAFFKDGSVISVRTANSGAVTLEDDGTLLFKQNDDATAAADVRFKTVPLNPTGTQTGKIVLDFDVTSSKSTNTLTIKYGENNSACDNLYNGEIELGEGRIVNFKLVIDYDNSSYSLYKNGVMQTLSGNTTSQFTSKTAALMIFFANVGRDTEGNIGYESIESFAAYKIPSSSLEYEVVDSVAKDGGKAVQFTMPVDTVNSVATINGKQYGIVNAHKSGSVNAYAVDTSDLDAGTYDVTLNAVALEDSTKTATVNFQITLTGDRVIFTNATATIDEELAGRVRVTTENNRNGEIRPLLLVAQYDGEDVFVDVDSARTYINAYDTVDLSCRNNVNAGDYIKGYIWDSVTSAKPYCAPIEQ